MDSKASELVDSSTLILVGGFQPVDFTVFVKNPPWATDQIT